MGGNDATGNPSHDCVTIKGNTVVNAGDTGPGEGDGIDIKPGLRHLVVEGNHVYGCQWHGIVSASGGTFRKNKVHDNYYKGIYLVALESLTSAVQLDNNMVYDNGDSGIIANEGSNVIDNIVIVHNACRHNGTLGDYYSNIRIENNAQRTITLKNNATTAVANSGGYECYVTTGTVTEDYNDFHGQIYRVHSRGP